VCLDDRATLPCRGCWCGVLTLWGNRLWVRSRWLWNVLKWNCGGAVGWDLFVCHRCARSHVEADWVQDLRSFWIGRGCCDKYSWNITTRWHNHLETRRITAIGESSADCWLYPMEVTLPLFWSSQSLTRAIPSRHYPVWKIQVRIKLQDRSSFSDY
jgi:hypothetical protein